MRGASVAALTKRTNPALRHHDFLDSNADSRRRPTSRAHSDLERQLLRHVFRSPPRVPRRLRADWSPGSTAASPPRRRLTILGKRPARGIPLPGGTWRAHAWSHLAPHLSLRSPLGARECFVRRTTSTDPRSRMRVDNALSRMSMLERADAPVRLLTAESAARFRSRVRWYRHHLKDRSPTAATADRRQRARALTALLKELRSAGTAIIIVRTTSPRDFRSHHAAVMQGGNSCATNRAIASTRILPATYREAGLPVADTLFAAWPFAQGSHDRVPVRGARSFRVVFALLGLVSSTTPGTQPPSQ